MAANDQQVADLVRVRVGQVSAAAVAAAGKRRTWHASHQFGRLDSDSGETAAAAADSTANGKGNKCRSSASGSSKRSSWHQRPADDLSAAFAYHMVLSDNCVPLRGSASVCASGAEDPQDRDHGQDQCAASPNSPLQRGHFSIAAWVERPAFQGEMQVAADETVLLRSVVSIDASADATASNAFSDAKRALASSLSANYFDIVVRDLRGFFFFRLKI